MEQAFTFFLHDVSAAPPAFEIGPCESRDAARDRALELLAERTRYRSVEVFDGAKSFTLERPQG